MDDLNKREIEFLVRYSYGRKNRYILGSSHTQSWHLDYRDLYWQLRSSLIEKEYVTKKRKITDKGLKVISLFNSFNEL